MGRKRARVLALVSTKGGCGKTTLAACLAAELHSRGIRVAMLDADPQGSLAAWHGRGGPLEQVSLERASGSGIEPALARLAGQAAVVVVDTPGFTNRDTLAVLGQADQALLPLMPSPLDAAGAAQTLELLARVNATAERARRPVQVRVVLTGATRGALVSHIRGELTKTRAHVLETTIGRRVAFAEAFLAGSAPCWLGRAARVAAGEVASLADEIGF